MKLFSIFILSFLLLSSSVKVSFVYGWYTLDVDSFISKLCENKNMPQLQCNGKCYLYKINTETSSKKEQTIPVLDWEKLAFCQIELSTNEQLTITTIKQVDFYYLAPFTKGYSYTFLKPPQV